MKGSHRWSQFARFVALWALFVPAGAFMPGAGAEPAAGGSYEVLLDFHKARCDASALPVVLTGREFFRLTGAPLPAVPSLRVRVNGAEVPFQVDERNGTGHLAKSNDILDDDDEIVFFVSFEKGKRARVQLQWSAGKRKGDSDKVLREEAPLPGVRFTEEEKLSYVELWAETKDFRLGLNAGRLADTSEHKIGNYGRAAFTVLEFRGHRLTNITSAWNNFLPNHPFDSVRGKHRWSRFRIAKQGPVRALLTAECAGYEKGARAELAIYSRGPAIDLAYSMNYERLVPEKRPQLLGFRYPMHLGPKGDTADVLLVPLAGEVYEHRLTERDLKSFYPTYYHTPLPEEGWFAWVDTEARSGLAVFYEKVMTIRDRAEWVDSRPACNPEVRIRTIPSGRPENSVTWHRRSIHTARSWGCTNRLVGLESADHDFVRMAYDLWARPLNELAEVSLPRMVGKR